MPTMASKRLLLWIITLLVSLDTSVSHTPEVDGVRVHEVVRPIRLHDLYKRDLESSRPNVVKYAMTLGGKDIEMHLERNEGLLAKGYSETHYTDDGTRVTSTPEDLDHCYYHGRIVNDNESVVSMSTCDGLRGYFQTAAQRYLIEPLSEDSGGDHAVLKYEDINNEPVTCGVTNTSWNNEDDYPPRTSKSRSRAAGPSLYQQQKYIELYLVADNREYKKMKSDITEVRKRMFEIINFLNTVYKPLNTFVALTGLEVWSDSDKISVTSPSGVTLDSFTKWRNADLAKRQRHDNAHLITAIDFDGSTVGLAFIGTLCSGHSTGVVQDHNPRAIAVGATLSHEMGHNLGMNHDTSSCACAGDSCIMAGALSYNIPRQFSGCSTTNYESFLNSRNPECLMNKPDYKAVVSSPVCGNGFLERGEQCDCGSLEECRSPCCNATSCTLTKGSVCASGDCCENCKILSPSRECRQKHDECDLPEYCTGKSAECPEDMFAVNGHLCQRGEGFCYNGQCPRRDDQCIKMWGATAEVATNNCYNQNTRGIYYAFCKRPSKDQYLACQRQDVFCGKLFCRGGQDGPNYGRFVKFLNCKATFYGDPDNDLGQVDTGTKCGDGMVCSQNECVDLQTAYGATNCSAKCKGHGVCNHKTQCQCEPGWLPPNCDQDDGSQLSKEGVIAIAVTFSLLLLIALIGVGIFLSKRRQRAPRPPGLQIQQRKEHAVNNSHFSHQRLPAPHQTAPTPQRPKAPPPPIPPSLNQPRPQLHSDFVAARQALRPPPRV